MMGEGGKGRGKGRNRLPLSREPSAVLSPRTWDPDLNQR